MHFRFLMFFSVMLSSLQLTSLQEHGMQHMSHTQLCSLTAYVLAEALAQQHVMSREGLGGSQVIGGFSSAWEGLMPLSPC